MESFIGQIQLFAFNFAPKWWMPCDGRTLQISQYSAVFALLGTTYGGDGLWY
jgi:microcystin-dependent protein